jgi:hypothetical protein
MSLYAPFRRLFLGSVITSVIVTVPTGTLQAHGFVPTLITWSPPATVSVSVGALHAHGFVPTVVSGAGQIVTVPVGTLKLTSYLPHINGLEVSILAPFGGLKVTGHAPMINEGGTGMAVYIGGTNATALGLVVALDGVCNISKQTIGRATASLDIVASTGGFVPTIAQTIRIVDYGKTLFAGALQIVQTDRQWASSTIFYHLAAVDRAGICDHRIVIKQYPMNPTDPNAAGFWDYYSVILDIVKNSLNSEGITTGGVQTAGLQGGDGALIADLNWQLPTVTQAFDQIAAAAGLTWWVDQAGVLYFRDMTRLVAAPFGLTETSGNWRLLKVTRDLSNYYNKIYAVNTQNVLSTAVQAGNDESWRLVDQESNVIPNPNDPLLIETGYPYVPVGVRTSAPIGSITSIVFDNIHTQSFYTNAAYHGQAALDGFDLIWLYDVGGMELRWVRSPSSTGDIVEAKYTPQTPAGNPLGSISGSAAVTPLTGTMGSGIYEGVLQVDALSSVDQLDDDAAAALARWSGIPTIIDFETDDPGLEPGQLLAVNVPLSGITSQSLLITTVTAAHFAADLKPQSGAHSTFRYVVQARSNLDPGNWIKWYERLYARTANQVPVANYEEAIFVLGTAGQSNPWPVSRPGPVFMAVFSAITPPGVNLTFQIVRNGLDHVDLNPPFPPQVGGIFPVGPAFTVPGGQIASSAYAVVQPGVPVNAYDILTLTVTIAGGGSIAVGCTLKVRWQVS